MLNEENFDFSLIADDVESSDGQTRHTVIQTKPVTKKEIVPATAE